MGNMLWKCRLPVVIGALRVYMAAVSDIFEAALPIRTKFYLKHLWEKVELFNENQLSTLPNPNWNGPQTYSWKLFPYLG